MNDSVARESDTRLQHVKKGALDIHKQQSLSQPVRNVQFVRAFAV